MYAKKKLDQLNVETEVKRNIELFLSQLPKAIGKREDVLSIVLFGSYAREEFSAAHSDVDLFILLDKEQANKETEEAIKKTVLSIATPLQVPAHLLFQYKTVHDEDKGLLLTIAREGKVLLAKKTVVISHTILGLRPYVLLRFDTSGLSSVVKNKLQRFLYGYKGTSKRYQGIVDDSSVFSAGQGAILAPDELKKKIMAYVKSIGVPLQAKGVFYRAG